MNDLADFSWYRGNLLWLKDRTIFLTKHGSHAYGTNIATSDLDIKGVAIAPKEYYLGNLNSFEQAETREPIDAVVYDIKKFFRLAADCNPNIIELMFTDQSDWIKPVINEHGNKVLNGYFQGAWRDAWFQVWEKRDLFLSKKAKHTFSGYAHAQLKRIKTHRKWLLNPPTHQPTRTEFGLQEGSASIGKEQLGVINAKVTKIADEAAGTGITKDVLEQIDGGMVASAINELHLDVNLIQIVIAERRYASACRNWEQYQTWELERNQKRAALEAKYGYDTKHAMHLVRLMRMGSEILSGQGVIVKRPDAQELLEIRNGAWTFDTLMEKVEGLDATLEHLYLTSKLPKEPDRKAIDKLLVDLISQAI